MYNIKILSICLIILFSSYAADHGDQKKKHERTSRKELIPVNLENHINLIDSVIHDMNLFGYSKSNIQEIRSSMILEINSILKNYALDLSDKDMDILLTYAISKIDKKIESVLMKNTKQLFDLIRNGSDKAKKVLKRPFFHLNAIDDEGFTLLMRAAQVHTDSKKQGNKLEAIGLLLKGGADKNIKHPELGTALQIAELTGNYEAEELLT